MQSAFNQLKTQLDGDLFNDNVQRVLYSTDASQYREIPLAVTRPKNKEDIKKIIAFARENGTSVIRAAAELHWQDRLLGSESWLTYRST